MYKLYINKQLVCKTDNFLLAVGLASDLENSCWKDRFTNNLPQKS